MGEDWNKYVAAILLMSSPNYKIHTRIGTSASHLHYSGAILDTGAGPNCIRKDLLPEGWAAWKLPQGMKPIVDAQNQPIPICGITTLYVQVGKMVARTHFIVYPRGRPR